MESEDDSREKRLAEVTTEPSEGQANLSRLRHKKYHNIPNELRLKLINAVEVKGERIKHVDFFSTKWKLD